MSVTESSGGTLSGTVIENSPALPPDPDKSTVLDTEPGTRNDDITDGITFRPARIFSSCMVLQREKPIRVWGFSDCPGSLVVGVLETERTVATVGDDGKWILTFSPRGYCREGITLSVSDNVAGHDRFDFSDILIGDVWMIGGQSNAELTLAPCMTLTPSIEFYDGDPFRLFTQTQAYPYLHQEYCRSPQSDLINPEWRWKRPDREASLEFSAMGYYFALEMMKYTDVPLGLVMMCAGGACIRELVPEGLARDMGYTAGANVQMGGYYNTLIHPLEGLAFKGMMFFQGESESFTVEMASRYAVELSRLVGDERQRFGFDFPFYNVQLSSYGQEGAKVFPHIDLIRVQQYLAGKLIPDYSLTVDMDLGAPDDYPDWPHSPRKQELGERLAKLIAAKEYGAGDLRSCGSPMPAGVTRSPESGNVVLEFDGVGEGLIVAGHAPKESYGMEIHGFSVGAYESMIPVKAEISGRCRVTVFLPDELKSVPDITVNYAVFNIVTFENADLRGGNNLPVPTFSVAVPSEP